MGQLLQVTFYVITVKLATDERVGDNRLDDDILCHKPEKEQDVVKPEVVETATLTGQ